MPNLTNAHTHLELNWLADYCPPVSGVSFFPWIVGLIERGRGMGDRREKVNEASIEDGLLELLSAGTTHVGDITLSGLSIGPLLSSGLKGIVYVEVLGLYEDRVDDYLSRARAIIERWRPQERNGMQVGITIHTPYSVHPKLWEKALDYARREALPLCIHAAEHPAEFDYLMHGTGPIVDEYYAALEMPPVPPPHTTPIRYLEDIGALALKPLLVHTVQVSEDDIMRIAANECSVVHCPRSNLRLQCGRMPLEAFLNAGVPVYLGTDSRASSPSLDVRAEVEVAAALHYGRVPADVIEKLAQQPFPPEPEEIDEA
jgi:aminodeoxyfutalosine deaminase